MLVKLLSLTEEGQKKIVRSVKVMLSYTEVGGLRQAKGIFDRVRDGQFITIPLDRSHSPTDSINELQKYFTLEVTNEEAEGLERLTVFLTNADELALMLGFNEEHEALVSMVRGLNDKKREAIENASLPV